MTPMSTPVPEQSAVDLTKHEPSVAQQPAKKRPGTKGPAIAAVVIILLVVGGVILFLGKVFSGPPPSVTPAAPTSFTFTGILQMHISDTTAGVEYCSGKGGYDDIKEGALVTIYDETGKVIQTGTLPTGSSEDPHCNWHISIPNVPIDAKFYQVEISHRGKITVSAADAQAGNFGVTLG